MKPKINIKLFI